jgi:hypothetical protein
MSESIKLLTNTRVTFICGSNQDNSQMSSVLMTILTGFSSLVSISHQVVRSVHRIIFLMIILIAARSLVLVMLQVSHKLRRLKCVRNGMKKESKLEMPMHRLLVSHWLSLSLVHALTLMTV